MLKKTPCTNTNCKKVTNYYTNRWKWYLKTKFHARNLGLFLFFLQQYIPSLWISVSLSVLKLISIMGTNQKLTCYALLTDFGLSLLHLYILCLPPWSILYIISCICITYRLYLPFFLILINLVTAYEIDVVQQSSSKPLI